MDLVTNPISRVLRNFLRRLGLASFVKKHVIGLWVRNPMSEEQFGQMLIEAARPRDVVWDVGANVGLYTTKLLERVGESGVVCAFEPAPDNLMPLRAAVTGYANVHIFAHALGDQLGQVEFSVSGTTGQIVGTANAANTITVAMVTGDSIVAEHPHLVPCVMKIDTEGAEFAVLSGLATTLADRRLRSIFVEVHFGLLESTGRGEHPKRILGLRENGFATQWIDASHLLATRD